MIYRQLLGIFIIALSCKRYSNFSKSTFTCYITTFNYYFEFNLPAVLNCSFSRKGLMVKGLFLQALFYFLYQKKGDIRQKGITS